jgi:hypothetical protein
LAIGPQLFIGCGRFRVSPIANAIETGIEAAICRWAWLRPRSEFRIETGAGLLYPHRMIACEPESFANHRMSEHDDT